MSNQAIGDMLDDLDSTRVKLRLAAARRRLWSIVASQEDAAAGRAHPVSQPPPSAPDENEVPSGGFQ